MLRSSLLFCVLFAVTILTSTVSADPRRVIVEEFSNTSCPYCPAASAVIDGLAEEYPLDMITITYHTWWPSSSDPYYQFNVSENTVRVDYYGVNATPTVVVDGSESQTSGGAWEGEIVSRAAQDSPLSIDLSVDIGMNEVTAEITNTGASNVTGLVHFVIVENGLVFGGRPHNHTMRDFLPDTNGEAISLNPTDSIITSRNFVIDPIWVEENLECIVFVQKTDGSKEIVQANRVFFPLDEPELALASRTFSDVAGGDGNGNSDPGESIDVTFDVANLGLEGALGVTATLSTADPFITVDDGSGTFGDIAAGTSADNAADPFTVSIDGSTPYGHEAAFEVDFASSTSYTKTVSFELKIGSPHHPVGADDYGYFAYEDLDTYEASPAFDWVEIDPNLGGAGTLVTLGDDQTTGRTLSFPFKYYGDFYENISVSSNGWIAMGQTGSIENANGDIPASDGPPRMIAGFWTDLNPVAAGGGKIYEYDDVANSRYIIEYSGVEHYHEFGLGTAETFQFILNDPAVYPTQTGDGEIILQYLDLTQPGSCTVGIEDATETIGLQYSANGNLSAAAHGLVGGRAVKFTTTPPTGLVAVGDAETPPIVGFSFRPNPFRTGTTIRYSAPGSGRIQLRIFRPDGSLVRTLFDRAVPAGTGDVTWDGRDARGAAVPDGVYLYRLTGDGFTQSGKVVRVK